MKWGAKELRFRAGKSLVLSKMLGGIGNDGVEENGEVEKRETCDFDGISWANGGFGCSNKNRKNDFILFTGVDSNGICQKNDVELSKRCLIKARLLWDCLSISKE
jgi:hypothetical protein